MLYGHNWLWKMFRRFLDHLLIKYGIDMEWIQNFGTIMKEHCNPFRNPLQNVKEKTNHYFIQKYYVHILSNTIIFLNNPFN